MQPGRIMVTITQQGTQVVARTSGPPLREDHTDLLNTRLEQRAPAPPDRSDAAAPFNAADAVIHRAGFIWEMTHHGRSHRLPAGMTDPAEQRQTVARAVEKLRAAGHSYTVEDGLLTDSLPARTDDNDQTLDLGDRLRHLAEAISRAGQTSQVVAALSELTAPGSGLLDSLTEVLYADRRTAHPQPQPTTAQEPRVAAARASSPAARRTSPPLPPAKAVPITPPGARPKPLR
jgi:hypothetical protein